MFWFGELGRIVSLLSSFLQSSLNANLVYVSNTSSRYLQGNPLVSAWYIELLYLKIRLELPLGFVHGVRNIVP